MGYQYMSCSGTTCWKEENTANNNKASMKILNMQ